MPSIRFKCPMCDQSLEAPEELANMLIDCPACSNKIEIPQCSDPAMVKALPALEPPPLVPPVLPPSSSYNPDAPIRCPMCHSSQVTANSKGFGVGKAVVGGILLGPFGLLGGLIGGSKIKITCLKCGHCFEPGTAR